MASCFREFKSTRLKRRKRTLNGWRKNVDKGLNKIDEVCYYVVLGINRNKG